MKYPKKEKLDVFYLNSNPVAFREEAIRNLQKAKRQELRTNKKPIRLNSKTIVLR